MALYKHSVRVKVYPDYNRGDINTWVEDNIRHWYAQYSRNMRTVIYYFESLSDVTLFMLVWGEYVE